MALNTKEAGYIILLGIVISVLPISSTLLQDGYHVRFKQNSKHKRRGANQTSWITSKQKCPINLLSKGIRNAISRSDTIPVTASEDSDTIPVTISEYSVALSKDICNSHPATISEADSDHSHHCTLLHAGGLWQRLCEAVGQHLGSRYVTQVDLSIARYICCKIVRGCNVCNYSSTVDPVLDARDQWLWIREHMRDCRDAELVQEIQDLCESHAANSERIVFDIGRGQGNRLLVSQSPVDRSSEGDDQSTSWFIVLRVSSIVRIDITSRCIFSAISEWTFSRCSSTCYSERSSEIQSAILRAIDVPNHELEK